MTNVTLAIDDDVLRRARIRALHEGTSVNAVVRRIIENYAQDSALERALQDAVELAISRPASSGPGGRTWTRDELYDRGTA